MVESVSLALTLFYSILLWFNLFNSVLLCLTLFFLLFFNIDPEFDLSLTLLWPCFDLALTLPWHCLDPAFDLSLTLLWPCLNSPLKLPWLSLELPWPCFECVYLTRGSVLECWSKKTFGSKNIWVNRSLVPKNFWSTQIKAPKKLSPKSFVKMGSVTAQILLICAKIVRTYVFWTNFIMTVGIC